MVVLLRWWFLLSLSIVGAVIAQVFGVYEYVWKNDATKLSFVILVVFLLATVFVGVQTYRARNGDQAFEKHLPFCWFLTEKLLGLGIIGTLIGFLLMLQTAFSGSLDLSSAGGAQKALAGMALGFATAGLTTLAGLICSLLLKLQLINLEYLLHEDKEDFPSLIGG